MDCHSLRSFASTIQTIFNSVGACKVEASINMLRTKFNTLFLCPNIPTVAYFLKSTLAGTLSTILVASIIPSARSRSSSSSILTPFASARLTTSTHKSSYPIPIRSSIKSGSVNILSHKFVFNSITVFKHACGSGLAFVIICLCLSAINSILDCCS